MVLAKKLSLWSFVRLDGFLLVFGVLMLVFCGVRKVRRFLALVPAIQGVTGASISNDRSEAGDITRLALWEKIRDNFFLSDDGRTKVPPNPTHLDVRVQVKTVFSSFEFRVLFFNTRALPCLPLPHERAQRQLAMTTMSLSTPNS